MSSGAEAPHGVEHVVLGPEVGSETWWSAYAEQLRLSGIGETSREVIREDAEFIVNRGIFGLGEPDAAAWPPSRERRGLVMGAVQSGKTASMMAVAALALDRGVDALVILGGTRTALWAQTLERVIAQLDTLPDSHTRRVRIPGGRSLELEGSDLDVIYSLPRSRAANAMSKGRPFLVVAMKNTAHLERLSGRLRDAVYSNVVPGRPFHLLVIDDEADDSSVADASGDPIEAALRQVPRRILDLWELRNQPGETARSTLFATYLAYTATPQANFLQDPANPLAPTDFVASLRTPGRTGDPCVRETSYRVPDGVKGWYTGGEIYYKELAEVPLCIPTADMDAEDLVIDGVRGYLIASALRVLRDSEKIGPVTAQGMLFRSRQEARSKLVSPMSMLINPAAKTDEHFVTAEAILAWSHQTEDRRKWPEERGSFGRTLGVAGVEADLFHHHEKWIAWLNRYREGADRVAKEFAFMSTPAVSRDWNLVRSTILGEIVPATGVAVINSDDRADDRPQFEPSEMEGVWRSPTNSSTIFVSGNVMSRGLTLEGLTTTVFTRSASSPMADTQMQMQRWFGFRGAYIDLCRVIMPSEQIALFGHYHENDEALRRDVLRAMGIGPTPDLTILQGRSFRATGKIANLSSERLFPGPKPFVKHMNPKGEDSANLRLVADLFSEPSRTLPARPLNATKGLLLDEPVELLVAADLLDRLQYVDHGPGVKGPEAARWRSVAHHAQLLVDDPSMPLFRAPLAETSIELGAQSPYEIAAYFRLWAAVTSRRVPGLMTTDDRPLPWNLVEMDELQRRRPRFWLGLRFGSGELVRSGPLAQLHVPVRPMTRNSDPSNNDLDATWGSRNTREGRIVGDEVFERSFLPAASSPQLDLEGRRIPGSDGLILFHVIARADGSQSIAVGVSIPLGGPDHVKANS